MTVESTVPDPIVIVGAARTPTGELLGNLTPLKSKELGAKAIEAAISRAGLKGDDIDEVIMGCVLPAGEGQAPARQASLAAGIPRSVGCTTINKMCGSGMKAVMLACDLLKVGPNKIMVAGGMESMTNAPYLLERARMGYRLGHAQMKDHMFLDGLEDAYEKGKLMGAFAETTAEKYGFSRLEQDEFAKASLLRAKESTKNGYFTTPVEIVPVIVKSGKEEKSVQQDEHPEKVNPEKIPTLKPSFKEDGTITPANSSSIADGAAALVLTKLSEAKQKGLKPLAKVVGYSQFAQEPQWFTTAPVGAIKALLSQLNWKAEEVDLYEINEAFAVVTLVAMKELNLPHEKVNVHGGACALGHPIGASGARIICTLLGAMKRLNKQRGIAALCIGGGEATAIALEKMEL